MKVALYDPDPVLGGMGTWTRQMQHGLRAAGAECDVVSFTKSGKPRVSWGRPAASTEWYERPLDKVGKYVNCKDLLAEYDRIVLVEPLMGLQDKEAVKRNWSVPYYARVLDVAGIPFTTVLQSFSYAEKDAPFAAAVVSLPSFIGTGFAHAAPSRVLKGNRTLMGIDWVQAPHPYLPARSLDDPVPLRGVAGCTGRFAHINAFHLPAAAAARGHLPDGTTVQLKGACAVSSRPSYSLEVYEAFQSEYGYQGKREGDGAIRPHPWVLWKDGSVIRYDGAYEGGTKAPVDAASTMQAHISLMSADKSTWVTNYVQLEAVDAGCVPVATTSHWNTSFGGYVLDPLPSTPSVSTITKEPGIQKWVAEAGERISTALSLSEDGRRALAHRNREMLRVRHDPAASAKALMEVLG